MEMDQSSYVLKYYPMLHANHTENQILGNQVTQFVHGSDTCNVGFKGAEGRG